MTPTPTSSPLLPQAIAIGALLLFAGALIALAAHRDRRRPRSTVVSIRQEVLPERVVRWYVHARARDHRRGRTVIARRTGTARTVLGARFAAARARRPLERDLEAERIRVARMLEQLSGLPTGTLDDDRWPRGA